MKALRRGRSLFGDAASCNESVGPEGPPTASGL